MTVVSHFRAFVVLASIAALLTVFPSANATGTLGGQVFGLNANNQPVPLYDAKVTIFANGTQVQSVAVDGFDASYNVALPPGMYVVTAECPSYNAQSKVVGISNWHATELDFYLTHATVTTTSITMSSTTTSVSSTAMATGTTTLLSLSVSLVSPPSPLNGETVTSSSVTLEAQVTSDGAVQNAAMIIYVDGTPVSSGFSNSSGFYSISYPLTQTGHTYSWYAVASKSGYSSASSSTSTFIYPSEAVTGTTTTSTTSHVATTALTTTTTSITTTTVTLTSYTFTTSETTITTSTQTAMVASSSTISTTTTKTPTASETTYSIPLVPSCLIATAAYGSSLSPQVQALRNFRDGLVLKTFAGTQFMKAFNGWYYSFSPSIAPIVSKSPSLAAAVRILIYPLIGILQIATTAYAIFSWNSELAVTMAGLLASSLIGLVYDTLWITALLIVARKKRGFEMKFRYIIPFADAWIAGLAMIGIADFLIAPLLMTVATSAFVLLTLGLCSTVAATLITKFG
jgi:hypothetical protein